MILKFEEISITTSTTTCFLDGEIWNQKHFRYCGISYLVEVRCQWKWVSAVVGKAREVSKFPKLQQVQHMIRILVFLKNKHFWRSYM